MRKFTLFFSLLLITATTAMAQQVSHTIYDYYHASTTFATWSGSISDVIDGDVDTYFYSAEPQTVDKNITLILNTSHDITGGKIYFLASDQAHGVAIEVKETSESEWTIIDEFVNSDIQDNVYQFELENATTVKEFRLRITQEHSNWLQLAEIELFESINIKQELTYAIEELRNTQVKYLSSTQEIALTTTGGEAGYISCPQEHNIWNPNNKDGGGIDALIDGSTDSYMHTAYQNNQPWPHYIQVDLGEGICINYFQFDYTTRKGGYYAGDVKAMRIEGSNSADFSTTEILAQLTPNTDGEGILWTSPIINNKNTYRYLRFYVTATDNNNDFFHMSEFNLYNCIYETDEQHEYNKNINEIITVAENVLNDESSTIEDIIAETNKIKRISSPEDGEDFVNGAVYTFISSRGWLIYNSNNPNVLSSTSYYSTFTTGDNVDACQWAVYKSKNTDKFYLYNIAANKFIGKNSDEGGQIPFVETPTNDIQIYKSTKVGYPIIMSTDNYGAINHFHPGSNKIVPGIANWKGTANEGGLRSLNDDGSAHIAKKVGTLDKAVLATIEELIKNAECYPEDGKVYRIKNVINNYGTGNQYHYIANATTTLPTEADNTTTLWVAQQTTENNKFKFISVIGDNGIAWRNIGTAIEYTVGPGVNFAAYKLADGNKNLAVTNEAWNGGLAFNQSTDNTSQSDKWSTDFIFEEVADYSGFATTIAKGSNGNYGTINLPFAVTLPEGVTAHGVTLSDDGTYLKTTDLQLTSNILPANTPALLIGTESGSKYFAPAPSNGLSEISTGLAGTLAATAVTTANAYILAYEGGTGSEIKFFELDGTDNTINANKAYYVETSGASLSTSLHIDLPGTTGIDSVEAENEAENIVYDLTGRRVEAATAPGIYIVNGKKVLVK